MIANNFNTTLPIIANMLTCLRCDHKWQQRGLEPKRCPKCKSYLWNKKPTIKLSEEAMSQNRTIHIPQHNFDLQRLTAQIDSLHEEVANERHLKEQLLAERLPPTKVLTEPLEAHPIIHLPPNLYAPLKSHLAFAMRDKYPEIKFELKENEIQGILS